VQVAGSLPGDEIQSHNIETKKKRQPLYAVTAIIKTRFIEPKVSVQTFLYAGLLIFFSKKGRLPHMRQPTFKKEAYLEFTIYEFGFTIILIRKRQNIVIFRSK